MQLAVLHNSEAQEECGWKVGKSVHLFLLQGSPFLPSRTTHHAVNNHLPACIPRKSKTIHPGHIKSTQYVIILVATVRPQEISAE